MGFSPPGSRVLRVLLAAIVRGVRLMDEMQRRIHLEAAATCLAGTAMITITYGFLAARAS